MANGLSHHFSNFARTSAIWLGSPVAFFLAVVLVIGWAAMGPAFGFSDEWSLFINTGTTIVTFLMVFLIQNTQNRDMLALHLKLDELVLVIKGARNEVAAAETLSEDEIDAMKRDAGSVQ